ncbi:MAG: metallophosphoesterase [Kiloniellaceae bacterium]
MKNLKTAANPQRRAAPAEGPAGARERQLWKRRRAAMETRRNRSTPEGIRPPFCNRFMKGGIRLFGQVARRSGLYDLGLRNALDVRVESLPLDFAHLPAPFDGYRILHITDPHFDAMEGLGDAVHRAVQGCKVDLCVFTGDYRSANDGPFSPAGVVEPLSAILDSVEARDGFLATLGNHDTHEMVDVFERLGLRVLANETARFARDGCLLSLTGVDDVYRYYTPMANVALRRAADFGPGHFGVALVHSPELAAEAAATGYSLYLCGHTHGGQICPPDGKPFLTPVSRNHHLARGLWRLNGLTGYTSRGAGVSGLPLRYFAPAEVTMIMLGRRPAGD